MPKAYEAMRDEFMKEGMGEKAAKGKAAAIYNSKHPTAPVGRNSDEKTKKKRTSSKKVPQEKFMQDILSTVKKGY